MSSSSLCHDKLAQWCVQHLQREEDALRQLNTALLAVRDALRLHQTHSLADLLADQQQHMQRVADVRNDRARLRAEIAKAIGVREEQATIARWAESLTPADRQQVLQSRDRVAVSARQTAALADGSIAVVTRGMQVLADVMRTLTGRPEPSGRYAQDGSIGHPISTHLYQNNY